MNESWPWLALAGLGLFHGINPAMGWLFAVALGLHRQSERVVWLALIPIAIGHATAIALTVALVAALNSIIDLRPLAIASGVVLIGCAGIASECASACGRGFSAWPRGHSSWRARMGPAS